MKLAAFNIWIVFLVVCLYSPGLIGLSWSHENVLVAASSITTGVMLALIFLMVNWYLLADRKAELIQKGEEKLDQKVAEVMEGYKRSKVLGEIAKSTLAQIKRLQNAQGNFENLVNRRFEPGTLSYKKFMRVMEEASRALENGYILMSNKMLIFDEAEYAKLSTDDYRRDAIPDDIQEEKKKLYDRNLESIQNILRENEKILLGLDHLMMGISDTDYSEKDVDNAAAEINNLLKQLEYYK